MLGAQNIVDDIHDRLQRELHDRFTIDDGWNYIKTKGGRTQKAEHSYKSVVRDAVEYIGGTIVREAGSQQKNDMTVLWPNGRQIVYELKKKDSKNGMYMCNDSVPREDVVYIFINTGLKSVQICADVASRLERGLHLKNTYLTNIEDIRRALDTVERDPCATNILNLGFIVMTYISLNVNNGIVSLFEFAQFFKRNYYFTTCVFRPRPNFMICHNTLL